VRVFNYSWLMHDVCVRRRMRIRDAQEKTRQQGRVPSYCRMSPGGGFRPL